MWDKQMGHLMGIPKVVQKVLLMVLYWVNYLACEMGKHLAAWKGHHLAPWRENQMDTQRETLTEMLRAPCSEHHLGSLKELHWECQKEHLMEILKVLQRELMMVLYWVNCLGCEMGCYLAASKEHHLDPWRENQMGT